MVRFQEKIEKELFNTRVLFTFCIDSNKCPNHFNAVFTEDKVHGNAYWFKGSSPLGIVGNRPVFIDSPTGELKQYNNILEAIYDYVDFNLMSDTVRPKDHSGFIESTKKRFDRVILLLNVLTFYLVVKNYLILFLMS